ncbi:MAG: hypothetical protein Q8P46_06855 [Hyphomicrobiales bacterium]|nr:hypothetical protein [Hyphomicrobiales bacterium]
MKQMASGAMVDLGAASPEQVDFDDIAIALSLICRFNGALSSPWMFYSVAQHSALVADLLPPDLAVYGLLHDAHEAYFGDDITPKKRLLKRFAPVEACALEMYKEQWDYAIWMAAGIDPPTPGIRVLVKNADLVAAATERRDLLSRPKAPELKAHWASLPEPDAREIDPLPPWEACEDFLRRLWDAGVKQ